MSDQLPREPSDEPAHRIAELEAQLRRAEDVLRARDEILAAVTHDLRNPLGTIVMGATALLQQSPAGDPRAQRVRTITERIHRQADRMTRQIRDLQDFAEIEAGRFLIDERTAHAPSAIVAAVGELVGPPARERGLVLEAHAPVELAAVACDPERVIQALSGLAAVAIKVTPRAAAVEIGAREREPRGTEFFVRDRGPGLPDDELAAMFEPTWRSAQAAYRGAALHLTIARAIAVAHGGAIRATSTPGEGTTVWLALSPAGD